MQVAALEGRRMEPPPRPRQCCGFSVGNEMTRLSLCTLHLSICNLEKKVAIAFREQGQQLVTCLSYPGQKMQICNLKGYKWPRDWSEGK